MRKLGLVIVLLTAALPAAAQLDREIAVPAGSPEDKALSAIDATTNPRQKLALIDQFAAAHPQGDMALAADELYVTVYLSLKNYAKAYEYGDKALAINPSDLNVAVQLIQAGQEQGEADKIVAYGGRVAQMVAGYKAAPPPAGVSPSDWAAQKQASFTRVEGQINWVADVLLRTGRSLVGSQKAAQARAAFGAAAALDSPSRAEAEAELKKLGGTKAAAAANH